MSDTRPILIWLRRDFRLIDHPALATAAASGRPVIPVFVLDALAEGYGAAPKWRLGQAIARFQTTLAEIGSGLVLRRGDPLQVLQDLAAQTGAADVWWTRAYDPDAVARDRRVKAGLTEAGLTARSLTGHVMFEPWEVATQQGGYFKVYSAYWRSVKDRDVGGALPAPARLRGPETWPDLSVPGDDLADWRLGAAMQRGAESVARYAQVGEAAALARLDRFMHEAVEGYKDNRDVPSLPATSGLSENLAWGEISPRVLWAAGQRAMAEGAQGGMGAEHFLKEVVWREFAYHLVYHTPHITTSCWRPEWDGFGWDRSEDAAVLTWQQGRTGVPFVDAAMRELYVTGTMHNRARMIAASFLTKHLLKHWQVGQRWFEDCLIDWDPAANAMGWQWVAGCGPDASPYFRVFNPVLQAKKFDGEGLYQDRFLAEGRLMPSEEALAFYEACPRSWGLSAQDLYPDPFVEISEGRKRALAAYENR